MRVRLEFLGMRKSINVSSHARSYKVALPIGTAPAAIMPAEQKPITTEDKYISLVFTPEENCHYGLANKPKRVFVFDHVEIEAKNAERGG